ncbi:MAG: class I SAM-dependent methyltransferase [Cyanobium sp.]
MAPAETLERLTRWIEAYEQQQPGDPAGPEARPAPVANRWRQQLREVCRQGWAERWRDPTARPRWADRGVSPEIVAAVQSGWCPARGWVLDVGCGLGEVTAWFAHQGFRATGIDFPEAIEKAAQRHAAFLAPSSGSGMAVGGGDPEADGLLSGAWASDAALQFMALDICAEEVPPLQFDVLIDRGCLHAIPLFLHDHYVRNMAALAAPGAKMLLFIKAFRKGQPFADQRESEHHHRWVSRLFSGLFAIEDQAPTYLNAGGVCDPANPLPGLVFWLRRSG